ncbi:MAG TPA: hypothetical protein VG223_18640 [Solirubrobacteraceae bacterium]|jgi:hypothetical protein|nr:hypothetical protein [Solirubrobacteraceae bacterium]
MLTQKACRPAGIGLAGALIVVSVAAALGVSQWRYQAATDTYNDALALVDGIASTSQARTVQFDIALAGQRFSEHRNPTDLALLQAAGGELAPAISAINPGGATTNALRAVAAARPVSTPR